MRARHGSGLHWFSGWFFESWWTSKLPVNHELTWGRWLLLVRNRCFVSPQTILDSKGTSVRSLPKSAQNDRLSGTEYESGLKRQQFPISAQSVLISILISCSSMRTERVKREMSLALKTPHTTPAATLSYLIITLSHWLSAVWPFWNYRHCLTVMTTWLINRHVYFPLYADFKFYWHFCQWTENNIQFLFFFLWILNKNVA